MGVKVTALPSAARTALTFGPLLSNYSARGAILRLSITSAPNTAETLSLRAYHVNAAGQVYSAAGGLVAIGSTPAGSTLQSGIAAFNLVISPGASAAAADTLEVVAAAVLPPEWMPAVNPSGASAWTYQLDILYL